MTFRTVYRKTGVDVALTLDGKIRSVTAEYPGLTDLTNFLTDEQKEELAAQVRREIEEAE